ncbi:MAG: MFS transporter [Promethearchaeota archaeon]|nr:MAG: MFS transporter [Candidatus Lokiarchaeota archaeon]
MTEKLTNFKKNDNLKEQRVLSTGKAIIFTLPNMGLTAILAIAVFFTLLFYINIMGQPPIIIGIIYSTTIIVYAVFCIIWGVVADKIGKKKVLLFSGPILAISFIFIWFPPPPTGSYGEIYLPLIIWLIFFGFVFRITIAGFQPIIYSLLPELSTEEQNRIKISMVNMIMMILGTVIGTIGPIVLMGDATKNLSREDPKLYYSSSIVGRIISDQIILFATLMSITFCICFILMLLIIKEPPKQRKEKASFNDILKELAGPFKDKNYRLFLLTFYLFWIPFVAFQYLVLNLSTFVISMRGNEFILMAITVILFSGFSFIGWKKLSEKFGLKETLSICLIFACISFLLFFTLIIPMSNEIILVVGILLIAFCFCGMVGTMVFPFAIMSDLIDNAESKNSKKLSGSYSGAFIMMGSLAAATTLLIISFVLELFGPEASLGYIIILSILGSSLLFVAFIVFQKVQLTNK